MTRDTFCSCRDFCFRSSTVTREFPPATQARHVTFSKFNTLGERKLLLKMTRLEMITYEFSFFGARNQSTRQIEECMYVPGSTITLHSEVKLQ